MISIADVSLVATRPTSFGVETPASSARSNASASCSMRRCTVAYGGSTSYPRQAHGSVEPREVVGAAIVGSTQLHEHLAPVAIGDSVRERLRRRAALANGTQPGDHALERLDELERVGCPIRRAEHDQRERSHDDADRDRQHDVERAGTDDSTRNSMSSTTAAHSARFHCRLSQTLAKVTTAALAARYAELGKLGSWIQPTVTPLHAIARVVSGSSSR